MKKTNQTEKQIAALLEKAGRTSDNNTPTTVIIADRGGETIPQAYGFFTREATSPQGCDDRNEPGSWNYSDEEEPNQIHIWRTNYDKPGDRTTPETTTLVFETSHEARTQAADHLETIVREAGMTRTDAYRDNAKGTDYARYTLEVPADQADDTGRSIALDMTANGIRTNWHVATEPGPDPNPEATPEEPTETLTLTTPDTFCSAQVKATAALAGFTRTDETTWTRTATKAEADRIFDDLPKALRATTPATTEWYLKRDRNSDEEEPNQIHIWSTDDDPDTRKEAHKRPTNAGWSYDQVLRAERDSLQIACTILRAELNQTKEILTQTQTERDSLRHANDNLRKERDQALKELEAGKAIEILERARQDILLLMMPAVKQGWISEADILNHYDESEITIAKLRTGAELTDQERQSLADLVKTAINGPTN